MGVWDTALFSNDLACDIRDHYRELIEDGVDDAEATRQTIAKYQESLDDPDDGTSAILALAVTQSKIGRLDPVIRDRALAAIERGGDLSVWAIDNPKLLAKRKQVLAKAREQLTGPQPARARVKRPSRPSCGLVAGDVLALDLPGGPALLRIVRVHVHRKGETPCLEELQFSGTELPSLGILEQPRSKSQRFDCNDVAGCAPLRASRPQKRRLERSGLQEGGHDPRKSGRLRIRTPQLRHPMV